METPLFKFNLQKFADLDLSSAGASAIDLPQLQQAVRWALEIIKELEPPQTTISSEGKK